MKTCPARDRDTYSVTAVKEGDEAWACHQRDCSEFPFPLRSLVL